MSDLSKSEKNFTLLLAAIFLATFSAIFFWQGPPRATAVPFTAAPSPTDTITAKFGICGDGPRSTCVVDGDTIWLYGTKIRIADINTPEVSGARCASEKRLGNQATRRLAVLLNEGNFSLEPIDRDEDSYGRKLRIVSRDGLSLGDRLVDEGLAERWTGSRRSWC